MMLFRFVFLLALISLLSACASVTGSPNQSVSVQARASNGKEVKEAAVIWLIKEVHGLLLHLAQCKFIALMMICKWHAEKKALIMAGLP